MRSVGYSLQYVYYIDEEEETTPVCQSVIYTDKQEFVNYVNGKIMNHCEYLFNFTTGRIPFNNKKYERTTEGFDQLYNDIKINLDTLSQLKPFVESEKDTSQYVIYKNIDNDDDDIESIVIVCHETR